MMPVQLQKSSIIPAHMQIALGELGQTEIPGSDHNDRIVAYFKSTSYHASADEVPWCAAYVNWVLEQAGVARTKSAAALSFLDWGVRTTSPEYGDIAVINRGGGKGHVGFYTGFKTIDSTQYVSLLGGNQSDSVNTEWFPASQIQEYRTSKTKKNSTTVKAAVAGTSASVLMLGYTLVKGAMADDVSLLPYLFQNWEQIAFVTTTLATSAYTWYERLRKIKLFNN